MSVRAGKAAAGWVAVGAAVGAVVGVIFLGLATPAGAQNKKDTAVLAMALEPPGLDPTTGAASAIAEVVLYNVFETLMKVQSDGSTVPLLAADWAVTPDLKTWSFTLRRGVKFHNGEPFDAAAVKFSFERAALPGSPNKDRATFANIETFSAPNAHAVVLKLKNPSPDLLFQLGQATAVIVEPKSAASNHTRPVGTGPYRLDNWARGSSVTLARWDEHRAAQSVALRRVQLRFINEPAAQVAALLSGDVDGFARVAAARSLKQFQGNRRFQVLVGSSRAKTILAINHQRKPLNDVRVRRAIAAAIDRAAVIEGSADGFGVPIGSYYVPGAPGYVDTTAINAYDPAKARALLKEAARELGFALPLPLTMKLPPTPYARQGGEVVAALLADVGITAKIENVEWAQWLSGVYGQKAYDLTLISHVEPFDFGNFARANYYWGYDSAEFKALWARIQATPEAAERDKLMAQAQRLVARDVVSVYLYQPTWLTVADARLLGLWKDMPLMVNDLAALRWQ